MNKFIMTFILLIGVINLKAQLGKDVSFGIGSQLGIDFNTLFYTRLSNTSNGTVLRKQERIQSSSEWSVIPGFTFKYGVNIVKARLQVGHKTELSLELGRYFLYNFGAGWDFESGSPFIGHSIGGRIPLDKDRKVWLEIHTKALVLLNTDKSRHLREITKDVWYIEGTKLDQFNFVPIAIFLNTNFAREKDNTCCIRF